MRPPRALSAPSPARLVGVGVLALAVALAPPASAQDAPLNDVYGAPGAALGEAEAGAPGVDGLPGDLPGVELPEAPADPPAEAEVDIAAMEAARQTAEAQARADAGDYDGAIALWSRLMATIPRTAAYAPRRASLLLAIVDAHERAYAAEHDPTRLRVAIDLLDRYLGELDPTDDENRVAVEGRRRSLAARLGAARAAEGGGAGDDRGPRPAAPDPADLDALGRRWTIAGGSLIGAGVLGLAVMGMGMILGQQADSDLAAARARVLTDPGREAAKQAALAAGIRANTLAYAGGVIGGVLTAAGGLAVLRGRRLRLRASGGVGGVAVVVQGRF